MISGAVLALLAALAPPPAPWALPAGELATQSLFRMRYDGPRGGSGQRVVLRLEGPGRFDLEGADLLGRSRWRVAVAGGEAVLVDRTAGAWCRAGDDLTLAEPGLDAVPVRELPRILLGRLPAAPAGPVGEPVAGRLDFRDASGRRWTVRLGADGPVAWTLWRAGEPVLWWTGAREEGILSYREGTQFRWRRAAREPLAGLDLEAAPGPDLRFVPCSELGLAGGV